MAEKYTSLFRTLVLENDRAKLTPFLPEKHTIPFLSQTLHHPSLYSHTPFGPFSSPPALTSFLAQIPLLYPVSVTFAIIDKTRPPSPEDEEGALAGMVSFIDTSATNLSTEIGGVIILPEFQRSHVATNAVGLMLKFALDGTSNGGLGLRRVQWLTSSKNEASLRLAGRLGFVKEGVLRWHMVMKQVEEGYRVGNDGRLPERSDERNLGRDTVVLSVCWDDWEGGERERVAEAMARVGLAG